MQYLQSCAAAISAFLRHLLLIADPLLLAIWSVVSKPPKQNTCHVADRRAQAMQTTHKGASNGPIMADAAQESFAALSDRLLPGTAALAAWCPTMDLLAVAFADGSIAVHRLNWQRLWLVTPDAAPTALAWTPGGESLAVGRADGAVSLLAAETGEVVLEDHFQDSGDACRGS